MSHGRRHSRHPIAFPVSIESPEKPGRFGMVRNLSETGLLLGTPSRYRDGMRVRLRYKLQADGPTLEVIGTIVRSGRDLGGSWWHRLFAVHFDRSIPQRRIQELARAFAVC